jgi:hypothetical protein
MKININILILLSLCTAVEAYTLTSNTIDNDKYYNYQLNTSETPFETTHNLFNIKFEPYNETIQYFNTTTNTTETRYNLIEWDLYTLDYGQFLSGNTTYNVTQDTTIPIKIDIDRGVGIYNTQLVLFKNNEIMNTTYYNFFITFGDVYIDSGYELSTSMSYINYVWFDGELPKTKTKTHTIKAEPNYKMTINCTGFIKCDKSFLTTKATNDIKATLTIPDGTALGTYKNYIFVNTSYGKKGNITYEIEIKHTPVEIIHKDIAVDKSIENMTAEELADLLNTFTDAAERKVLELEAANKTKEKLVLRNVSVPYLANKEEIVRALVAEFEREDKFTIDELSRLNGQLVKDMENVSMQLTKKKEDYQFLEIKREVDLNNLNNTLYTQNIIINKQYWKNKVIVAAIIGIVVSCLLVMHIKAYGGLSSWEK